jgi:hypothetical protein
MASGHPSSGVLGLTAESLAGLVDGDGPIFGGEPRIDRSGRKYVPTKELT